MRIYTFPTHTHSASLSVDLISLGEKSSGSTLVYFVHLSVYMLLLIHVVTDEGKVGRYRLERQPNGPSS